MTRCPTSSLVLVVALCASPAFAQSKAKAQNVPEILYDSVPNFLKLPAGLYLGESVGVATNSKGHVTPGPRQYLYSSNSNPPEDLDANGEIYKLDLDGRPVGRFGRAGKLLKEFGTANGIDCRAENDLYVAEIGNWRVQKIALHPR
jgi:hypothetical protein